MGQKRVAKRTWIPPPNNHPSYPLPLPPPNYYSKINCQEILENSEISLEEKFCRLSGIQWYEVLTARNHIYFYENVLKWDDSGAKDALFDAHERFCSMINSLPCELPLPDPDMYIDNIDWNPKIDPGLISGMDKEYCDPDEKENSTDDKISGCDDKNKISVDNPSKSNRLEDNVDVKDLAQGWNKCGDLLESKSPMNSSEMKSPNGDETMKDIKWGSSGNKLPDRKKGLNDARASGMRTRACRKREKYQASRKSQKHEDADAELRQFRGNGRPQRRYNLRSSKY